MTGIVKPLKRTKTLTVKKQERKKYKTWLPQYPRGSIPLRPRAHYIFVVLVASCDTNAAFAAAKIRK